MAAQWRGGIRENQSRISRLEDACLPAGVVRSASLRMLVSRNSADLQGLAAGGEPVQRLDHRRDSLGGKVLSSGAGATRRSYWPGSPQ